MPAPAASSQVSPPSDGAVPDSFPAIPRPPRQLVIALLVVAAVWWITLAWLAVTSANPVTLNREQLRQADAIVSVEILDKRQGAGRVTTQWSGVTLPAEITVNGLDTLPVRVGSVYIMPLTIEGPATVHITQARLGIVDADGAPLLTPAYVYPVGEESERQLRLFLETPVSNRR